MSRLAAKLVVAAVLALTAVTAAACVPSAESPVGVAVN